MTEFGWTTDGTVNLSHVRAICTTGGGGEVHEVFPYSKSSASFQRVGVDCG